MMFYRKKLKEWMDAGLITTEQGERIIQFEEMSRNRPWIFSGFMLLGITAIAIGTLSVVAANWDRIQPGVRLAGNFVLLAALINMGTYYYGLGKSLPFQIVMVLYYLLIPASIGLISQVFNTSGEFYQALFLWTIPTIPLVIFANTRTMLYLWLIPFTIGIVDFISKVLISPGHIPDEFYYFYLYIPIGYLSLGAMLRRFTGLTELATASTVWGSLLISLGLLYYQVAPVMHEYSGKPIDNGLFIHVGLASALFLTSSAVLIGELKGNSIFLAASVLLYLSQFIPAVIRLADQYDAVRAIHFILIAMLSAIFFARIGKRRIFDALLAAGGVRFLVLYFEAFGGLLMTGIGLILSGIAIIALTVAYLKLKENIYNMIQKISGGKL